MILESGYNAGASRTQALSVPMSAPWTLTARWVFPLAGPPLERGTVTMAGDRIAAVEPRGRRTADIDLGTCAILPGLVNAHTHLDLTGMRGLAPPTPDFTAWLRQVIAHRRQRSPEQVQEDIRAGLDECLRFGTTLVGDISAEGTSWDMLVKAPLRAVVFRELLGLPAERAGQSWLDALTWLHARVASPTCVPGLSPHAPYSVRASLLDYAGSLGWVDKLPLAIHLAETREELQLLSEHRGPFVEFLTEMGVWDPAGLIPRVEEVVSICSACKHVLFAHANYLSPLTPIPTNGTVVYCPRTHAAFGHPSHPFREFLARGVRVALGTDSLASNPDLDLLAEARFLHSRYPDVPPATLLRMATLSGAEALGWQDETGSLEVGKSADLVVLPLPDAEPADPHQLLFASSTAVQAVLWRGRWVHGTPDARPSRDR
jgi:cytosine/adenosine deaminase-related metal-dependent hydrolase